MPTSRERSGSSPLFHLMLLALVVAALYFAKEILLPVALAALLCFLLSPLVTRLERLGLGRILSVIVLVLALLVVFSGVGVLLLNQVTALSTRLPEYRQNLIAKIRSAREAGGKLQEVKETIDEVSKELTESPPDPDDTGEDQEPAPKRPAWLPWLADPGLPQPARKPDDEAMAVKVVQMPPSPLTQIQSWLGPLVAPLATVGVTIVLVIFLLIQREDVRDRVIQLLGTTNLYMTTDAIDDATSRVSRYLLMQLLINTCYGVGVGVGLSLIGLPNALLWGVLGLMLRFLPYVGPWLAASMPILLSLSVFDNWLPPMLVVGLFIVLELLVNNVLEPWLYGSSVGISSIGIIVAAVFWTWLWGPIGLVLAVPLTVCLIVAGRYIPQLRFLVILFSDSSTLAPWERLYQRLLARDYDEAERLASEFARKNSLEKLFDEVLIPALELAERDRHSGLMSDARAGYVLESTRELVDSLSPSGRADRPASEVPTQEEPLPTPSKARVLCVPAGDEADEVTASMLAELLRNEAIPVDVGSRMSLASEVTESAAGFGSDLVVICILPPLGARDGRYLYKRLRASYPDLPVVIGIWHTDRLPKAIEQLPANPRTYVVRSLAEAVARIRNVPLHTAGAPPTGRNQGSPDLPDGGA